MEMGDFGVVVHSFMDYFDYATILIVARIVEVLKWQTMMQTMGKISPLFTCRVNNERTTDRKQDKNNQYKCSYMK